jgi:aminopeptidase-like protein
MKHLTLTIFLLLGTLVFGQSTNDSLTIKLLKTMIYTLADDSMKGRASGSLEEQKTLDYLSTTFKQLTAKKLKTQSFSFLKDGLNYQCKNAYYFDNNQARKTIIIGAHYDHIGFGGPLSLSFTNDEIHNGADDNASGVGLLLSLSQALIKHKDAKVNYLIVFYSGHEIGLFGSTAFHKLIKSSKQFKQISTVINFDMVGRMDPTMKKLKCMRSIELDSLVQSIPMDAYSFKLNIADEEKLNVLDTKTFLEAGIPCINFTTGMHNDYHKSSDDAKYINFEGLNEIRKFILYFLVNCH